MPYRSYGLLVPVVAVAAVACRPGAAAPRARVVAAPTSRFVATGAPFALDRTLHVVAPDSCGYRATFSGALQPTRNVHGEPALVGRVRVRAALACGERHGRQRSDRLVTVLALTPAELGPRLAAAAALDSSRDDGRCVYQPVLAWDAPRRTLHSERVLVWCEPRDVAVGQPVPIAVAPVNETITGTVADCAYRADVVGVLRSRQSSGAPGARAYGPDLHVRPSVRCGAASAATAAPAPSARTVDGLALAPPDAARSIEDAASVTVLRGPRACEIRPEIQLVEGRLRASAIVARCRGAVGGGPVRTEDRSPAQVDSRSAPTPRSRLLK